MPVITAHVTEPIVAKTVRFVKARFPERQWVVLWDGFGSIGAIKHVACEREAPEVLDQYGYESTIFVYACTQDDIGSPFVRRIIDKGGKFVPIEIAYPIRFAHLDRVARSSLEREFEHQAADGFSKWDTGDFTNLLQALSITENLRGDFVEIGCFQGSSGGAVLRYLADKRRRQRCYFFDVFEGFTYEAATNSPDARWVGGHKTEGIEVIGPRLKSYAAKTEGLEVFVEKGNCITDPLPSAIEAISVANIDVDLYEAVLAALQKVEPLVVPGGIVVVEDPGHTPRLIGARVALDEFLANGGRAKFVPIQMESGQTFLIRNGAS